MKDTDKSAEPQGISQDPLDRISASTILKWLKEYRFIFAGVAAVCLGAIGGFVSTKASLGHQIDELRVRILKNEKLRDEMEIRAFYLQVSNLRLLEDEIIRIQEFCKTWQKPSFSFFKPQGSPEEVAQPASDEPILSFDLGSFAQLATSPDTRAIRDTELTATLTQVLNVLIEYNQEFQNSGTAFLPSQPVPAMGGVRIPLRFPLTKKQAERFSAMSAERISKLKGLLQSGLQARLQESRKEITSVIEAFKSEK